MLHTKYQSSAPSSFRERKFSKILLFFSFWQPELWVEAKLLNNFGRSSPKEHPCQVTSRLIQWFRRRRCLKKLWTTQDGRRMLDIGRSQKLTMSTLCSGELKKALFLYFLTLSQTTNFILFQTKRVC